MERCCGNYVKSASCSALSVRHGGGLLIRGRFTKLLERRCLRPCTRSKLTSLNVIAEQRAICLDSSQTEHEYSTIVPETACCSDLSPTQSWTAPTASVTRAVFTMSPASRFARSAGGAGNRSFISPGMSSALVVVVTIGTAVVAAFRNRLKAVRECQTCQGYGVQRCKLCGGRGTIEWEGKMAHREPCPMCLGRRLNRCSCCGGGPFLRRSLFAHSRKGFEVGLADLQALGVASSQSRRKKGLLPSLASLLQFGRTRVESNERIEESDQLAEQIMMD